MYFMSISISNITHLHCLVVATCNWAPPTWGEECFPPLETGRIPIASVGSKLEVPFPGRWTWWHGHEFFLASFNELNFHKNVTLSMFRWHLEAHSWYAEKNTASVLHDWLYMFGFVEDIFPNHSLYQHFANHWLEPTLAHPLGSKYIQEEGIGI